MRFAQALALAVLAIGGAALGCSSSDSSASTTASSASSSGASVCAGEAGVQTYSPGMIEAGVAGHLKLAIMDATPAPPGRGNNTWMVAVTDDAGKPVDNATLSAKSCMPKHGHCATVKPVITPMGGGNYQLTPLDLFMPGLWQVTINVAGTQTDQAVFSFCVEG